MSTSLSPDEKAGVLIEALPYFQQFRQQTFLIKLGGSAMENPTLVESFIRDVIFLEVVGINPVIVHGGGKAISAALEKAGIQHEFIGGLRKTSAETIKVVEKTLHEDVNATLVEMLLKNQGKAKGVAGKTIFQAEKYKPEDEDGKPLDLGYVGKVTHCDTTTVQSLLSEEVVPVISPLGKDPETGDLYNINADLAAAALAKELKPAKLIYLSDVPGLMRDPEAYETLIHSINQEQAKGLIKEGVIKGGMLPKVLSALDALHSGVNKVHFIDGRKEHSILLEIFTDSGIGTEIIR